MKDNGIGMNQVDVRNFLLEIGTGIMNSKGIADILAKGEEPESLISEFGIGVTYFLIDVSGYLTPL